MNSEALAYQGPKLTPSKRPKYNTRREAIFRGCFRADGWKLVPTDWLTPDLRKDLARSGFEFAESKLKGLSFVRSQPA